MKKIRNHTDLISYLKTKPDFMVIDRAHTQNRHKLLSFAKDRDSVIVISAKQE